MLVRVLYGVGMSRRKKYNNIQFWRKKIIDDEIFFLSESRDSSTIFNLFFEEGTTFYARILTINVQEAGIGSVQTRLRQKNPPFTGIGNYERNTMEVGVDRFPNYDYKFPIIRMVGAGIQPGPPFNPPDLVSLECRIGASRELDFSLFGWTENTKRV